MSTKIPGKDLDELFFTYAPNDLKFFLGIVAEIDAAGNRVELTRDEVGRITELTDRTGATWRYGYDEAGRRTVVTNPYGASTTYTYTLLGDIATERNALGHITRYDYDELGRLVTVTDPIMAETNYTYDGAGNLLSVTDGAGRVTTYTYDELGRLEEETNGAGETVTYAYDEEGRQTGMTDGKGEVYQYEYDALGRLVNETNRLGDTQSYRYDGEGNRIGKTDFTDADTGYLYDPLGRLTRVEFADGSQNTFTYDKAGNLIAADNEAREYAYAYDGLNRLVRSEDADLGQVVTYAYDAEGRRTRIAWLSDQRVTRYTYGEAGELLSVTGPDGTTTTYTYDLLLREIERELPNGIITERSYDPAGRVSAIRERKSRGELISGEGYVYDESGKRTYRVDERGRLTVYRYDEAGRLETALYPFGVGKASEDFEERLTVGLYPEYEEDGGGLHSSGMGDEPEHPGVHFGFRLPHVPDFDESEFGDHLSDLLAGREQVYEGYRGRRPDGWGRWHLVPGEGATEFAEHVVLTGVERQEVEQATRRVTGWGRHFNPERWLWIENYEYDENGNRLSKANGWGAIPYRYDEENRLQQAGERLYTYDENGNLTGEALGDLQVVYAYSPENRVVDVNTEVEGLVGRYHWGRHEWELESGIRYEYDALGRRVSRAEYQTVSFGSRWQRSWDNESVTEYLYDGLSMNPVAEYRDTEFNPGLDHPWLPWHDGGSRRPRWGHHRSHPGHRSWSWVRQGRFRPVGEYVYGNRDELIARSDFNPEYTRLTWEKTEYYHQDVLGSTAVITDSRGRTVERYGYDAFGNHYEGSFHRVNEVGYTGQRYDQATNLYNYGFRDYQPAVGRFTTVDPIRDGNNWYAYVGNDPVNFVDPWGLMKETAGNGTAPDPRNLVLVRPNDERSFLQRLAGKDSQNPPYFVDQTTGAEFETRLVSGTPPTLMLPGPPTRKLLTATPQALAKGAFVNAGRTIRQNPGSFTYGLVVELGSGLAGPGPDIPPATSAAERLGRTAGRVLNAGWELAKFFARSF